MTSTHANFTGVPFMAGSIRGERSFGLTWLGTLRSIMKPFNWKVDGNECRCLKDDTTIHKRIMKGKWPGALQTAKRFIPEGARPFSIYAEWREAIPMLGVGQLVVAVHWWHPSDGEHGIEYVPRLVFEAAMREDHGHNFATCSCGFYAYLNGCNEYEWPTSVVGIIEGFGETLIGDRGFRASKARILALAPGPAVPPELVEMIRAQYPTVPVFNDVNVMRMEFPTTDVTEFMIEKDEAEDES